MIGLCVGDDKGNLLYRQGPRLVDCNDQYSKWSKTKNSSIIMGIKMTGLSDIVFTLNNRHANTNMIFYSVAHSLL